MKKYLYLIAALMVMNLSAVNQMDIMTTIIGEHLGAQMGYNLASLDFNGDGVTDLVATANHWQSPTDSILYGRIYIYLGGTSFDNIPEHIWTGLYPGNYNIIGISNAGDFNGDGIEDLAIQYAGTQVHKLSIHYGRAIPSQTPDFELVIPNDEWDGFVVSPLGDINNDGFDDLSICLRPVSAPYRRIVILKGGTTTPVHFIDNTEVGNDALILNGIGDVDGDGIDDCHLYYATDPEIWGNARLTVYYGDADFPDSDSLIICENTNQVITRQACPVGDVNGDGIDDFISYMGANGKVWFGSPNLTTQWNVELSPPYFGGTGMHPSVIYGDFNGDGFDDVAGSDNRVSGDTGKVSLWLGGSNFNGTADLLIYPVNVMELHQWFGWAKATGDFNNDGFCDLAVSQPQWYTGSGIVEGKVYIYAGNADLLDTTVAVEDETLPVPDVSKWDISVYPNPLRKSHTKLKITFTDDNYKSLDSVHLEVFNPKGQRVFQTAVSQNELQAEAWEKEIKHLTSGIYIINLNHNSEQLISRKVTIN